MVFLPAVGQFYINPQSLRDSFLAGNGFFCEDSRPFCPLCGHSPNGGTLGKGAFIGCEITTAHGVRAMGFVMTFVMKGNGSIRSFLGCRKSTIVRNSTSIVLHLTREVGSLASSEGEITKRYRNTPMMDSSRIISIITQGIEPYVCMLLYSCVISPLAFFH